MKQWICVLSLVLLFTSMAGAGEWVQLTAATAPAAVQAVTPSPQGTILTSTINGFDKADLTIKNETFSLVTLQGEALTWEAGFPELPRMHRSLIIPDDALMAVRLVAGEYRDVPNIEIAPSHGQLLRSVDPATVPYNFASVYQKDAFWPAEIVSLGDPYILRDFRGQVVQIAPFQYNPVTHTLRVYTSMTLEVYQAGKGGVNVFTRTRPLDRIVPEFRQIYARHFVNFSSVDYTLVDEVGPLLVIANSAFMTNVQPLVNWKRQKGIPTTFVDVSTIGNNSSAIKTYITGLYNSPAGLANVLLVGDQAQVTSWMIGSSGCDPVYGQITGSDHYAELFVGRLSAETSAQVDLQVTKFLEYEKMPQTGAAWYAKALGVASNQGLGAGHHGEGDWQHLTIINNKLLNYGFAHADSVYEPWGNATQISTFVNAGVSMINYCGHGSETSWGTPNYSNSNVAGLTNDNMLPVITSVACVNGNFTGTTCFAEAWLRASHNGEPSGAIGFFGSSQNQSWAPPMDAQEEFVDNLVHDVLHSYGGLCFNGVSKMIDLNGSTGNSEADHWNLFGDPSLQLRTQPPTALAVSAPASVTYGQASLQVTVSGSGVGGALAGLYANGALIGYGYTNTSGIATLNLTWTPVGSNATLTVTSYNRTPYIVEIPIVGGSLPNLDVNLTPANPPIVIPATGGSFTYSLNMVNNESFTVSFAVWIMQQLPNGTWQGPKLGPVTVALPAGANVTRSRNQSVPASAPAGTYTYRAYLGLYDTQKWDSSSFTYTKSATGNGPIVTEWANSGDEISGSTALASTPDGFVLEGASPNPFNPTTNVSFTLPEASRVSLKVFDLQGRQVATLVDGQREAGQHQVTFDGSRLASGLYLYTLTAGQYQATGKMVLLK